MQLALGAVYAWSVFNAPLQEQFGWSKAEAVLPFEVAICTIFIGCLIGGRIQVRRGPRPVALGGAVLYALAAERPPFGTGREAVKEARRVEAHLGKAAFMAPVEAAVPGLGAVLHRCLRRDPAHRWPVGVYL